MANESVTKIDWNETVTKKDLTNAVIKFDILAKEFAMNNDLSLNFVAILRYKPENELRSDVAHKVITAFARYGIVFKDHQPVVVDAAAFELLPKWGINQEKPGNKSTAKQMLKDKQQAIAHGLQLDGMTVAGIAEYLAISESGVKNILYQRTKPTPVIIAPKVGDAGRKNGFYWAELNDGEVTVAEWNGTQWLFSGVDASFDLECIRDFDGRQLGTRGQGAGIVSRAGITKLSTIVAQVLGVGYGTVKRHDQNLRNGDLRAKGGRRASIVTPTDAANLMVAVVASRGAEGSTETVVRFANEVAAIALDIGRAMEGHPPAKQYSLRSYSGEAFWVAGFSGNAVQAVADLLATP